MKTLVGSPPPEEPEDDGPVYVVTELGASANGGNFVPAKMMGHQWRHWHIGTTAASTNATNATTTWINL